MRFITPFNISLMYSNWAIIFHVLFLAGLMPNTFSIAFFVFFCGSCVVLYNQIVSPNFDSKKIFVIKAHIIHILPMCIFLYCPIVWNWSVLFYTLGIYFLYMAAIGINPIWLYFNLFNINKVYEKQQTYGFPILSKSKIAKLLPDSLAI